MDNRGGPSSTSRWRSRGTEVCARDRHSANEDWWFGVGLRSATRCAAAACWASWADALAMISQRNPGVANLVAQTMEGELPCPQGGCLAEVFDASTRLDREGFWWRPSWPELRDGKRPPENAQHGWQYWASSVSDSYLRKTTMLSVRSATSRAHLRSHSGLNAGAAWFSLRHRAACARTGRLKKRATPIERMLVRVCREGGARVLAQDLPCFGGAQLAIDITLRGVLSSSGEPHPNAADVDGAGLARAPADKEATDPELLTGRCRLVVMAIETGGMDFVRQLAFAEAREVPSHVRFPSAFVWERRWTRMLSTACSLAFASSLVEPSDKCATWCWTGGGPPSLAELLGRARSAVVACARACLCC